MVGVYRQIDDCLAACGGEAFAPRLLDLVASSGARQLMIFDVTEARARCLLSCNFSNDHLGELLAQRYLDGWFRQDPLLPDLLGLPVGTLRLARLDAAGLEGAPDYRHEFFSQPGLAGKLSGLAAGAQRRLFVNFYYAAGEAERIDADLARLGTRLTLMHFDGLAPGAHPSVLDVLSVRERQVCLGVLEGKKTETIAGELALSPTTVTTYRKRAYDKLGIASRAALFAICR